MNTASKDHFLEGQNQDVLDEKLKDSRELMLKKIQREGVTDEDVLRALRVVPRHLLVPPHLRAVAYEDHPLPIGSEQTISQPTIVGLMSQWAIEGTAEGERRRVLEVGTGSGYQAAVLAELFAEVYTTEVRPDLADRAKHLLSRLSPKAARIHCVTANGAGGLREFAPFDAIVVTAAAQRIPSAFADQLKPGGRLVMPLVVDHDQQLLHLLRRTRGSGAPTLLTARTLPVLFVPLVEAASSASRSIS